MLKRQKLILVGTLLALGSSACGTAQAPSAGVSPTTTQSVTPSPTGSESGGIDTGADAPPLESNGHLDSETAALLAQLSPPKGGTRGGASIVPILQRWFTVRDCSQLTSWLKIKQPQLSYSGPQNRQVVCGTNFSGELPQRDGRMQNGQPIETKSYMIVAPQGVDVLNSSLPDVEDAGAVTLSFYSGPNVWEQSPPTAEPDLVLGGALDVELRDVQVGLQRIEESKTRLAWIEKNSAGETFNAELIIPAAPTNAASSFIKSQNIP